MLKVLNSSMLFIEVLSKRYWYRLLSPIKTPFLMIRSDALKFIEVTSDVFSISEISKTLFYRC